MISPSEQRSLVIWESKIIHKSPILHPLARFVTEETVALLFNIEPEHIYKVTCWRHVVHVHGKGLSRFVSYADFPPVVGVEAPTDEDLVRWRKRWKSKAKSKQAPEFWQKFFARKFKQATSVVNLVEWGKLVAIVKSALSSLALQSLREVYRQEKYAWENF